MKSTAEAARRWPKFNLPGDTKLGEEGEGLIGASAGFSG